MFFERVADTVNKGLRINAISAHLNSLGMHGVNYFELQEKGNIVSFSQVDYIMF